MQDEKKTLQPPERASEGSGRASGPLRFAWREEQHPHGAPCFTGFSETTRHF